MKDLIHVFVNRKTVDFEVTQIDPGPFLLTAGFNGTNWDILRLQGEGDPTGGTLIHATDTIILKNGDHFRVLPGNRTFGLTVAVPLELLDDVNEFKRITGLDAVVIPEENRIFVHIKQAPLPANRYRIERTDILFITDFQYRLSAMDMFWVDPDVVRPDGQVPQAADAVESYLGRLWRRFSWHRNGIWDPSRNGLLDHYAFVESRWSDGR